LAQIFVPRFVAIRIQKKVILMYLTNARFTRAINTETLSTVEPVTNVENKTQTTRPDTTLYMSKQLRNHLFKPGIEPGSIEVVALHKEVN